MPSENAYDLEAELQIAMRSWAGDGLELSQKERDLVWGGFVAGASAALGLIIKGGQSPLQVNEQVSKMLDE